MNEKEPRATSTVDVHQYSEWPEEEEEEETICKDMQKKIHIELKKIIYI